MRIQVRHLLQLANNAVIPGSLIMQYQEATSGRLYGQGVHLQNVMKEVRNAALVGMYDYDIENCHFALLDQMAAIAGYVCEAIRTYLTSKKYTRNKIASDVGITIKEAKTCLLAMVYGAENSNWYGAAIPAAIGQDKAQILYKHSLFNALKSDVEQARKAIIAGARKHGGNYINAMEKGIPTSLPERKVLAHLLQGMEARILNVIGKMHSENLVLLQHDGWVTKKPINVEMTENRIYEETGMKVELSEGIIGQDQFESINVQNYG